MKKNTYRCEDRKYKELQIKLIKDEMSWQGFVDKAVDDYLEGNYNPKGEMKMLRVFQSEDGQKIFVEDGKVSRHEHRAEVIEYNNYEGKELKELDLDKFTEVSDPEKLKIEKEFLEECKHFQNKENPYS